MNLLHAWKTLIESGRPLEDPLTVTDVARAVGDLSAMAQQRGMLRSAHPWELDPSVCRELHELYGYTPAGTWARLAGLAAGADILQATADGFVPVGDAGSPNLEELERRMVEAFTRRLIPPAAAAALYVALEVHPLWGLRLGREVGSCASTGGDEHVDRPAMLCAEELVFGTISALIATLRGLPNDRRFPLDALGDVLWTAGLGARAIASLPAEESFPPVLLMGAAPDERRMLTTRMAIADLFDHVFVPAGVGRRDDAGWFRIDSSALFDVVVGPYDLQDQEEWLCRMLWGEGSRRAC